MIVFYKFIQFSEAFSEPSRVSEIDFCEIVNSFSPEGFDVQVGSEYVKCLFYSTLE